MQYVKVCGACETDTPGIRRITFENDAQTAFIEDYRKLCEKHRMLVDGWDDGAFLRVPEGGNFERELNENIMRLRTTPMERG